MRVHFNLKIALGASPADDLAQFQQEIRHQTGASSNTEKKKEKSGSFPIGPATCAHMANVHADG
jgi:hypothetical protein